jgi:hypothetical protein
MFRWLSLHTAPSLTNADLTFSLINNSLLDEDLDENWITEPICLVRARLEAMRQ